jgi:predicted  nucleic acid-binding Zn-ribbon protein
MALPALKIEAEVFMEERVARLEVNVEHIQSDISEMKVDIRGIRSEIKEMDQRLTARIDGVKDSVAVLALSTEKSFGKLNFDRMVDRLWWVGISAALLSVVAKAFGWI